jgi:glycogen synthase
MRIVFLCDQYPPVIWDGAGTYTHTAAHALAELGHDVHVLCCEGRRWVEKVDDGVSVHCRPLLTLPVSRLLGRFRPLVVGPYHPRDSLALRAALALSYALWMWRLDLQPDVVETQDGETRALIYALLGTVPLVVHLHTPTMFGVRLMDEPLGWRGRLADRIDRVTSDRSDVLTAPSQLVVDALRTVGWLTGKSPLMIPLPFDAGHWLSTPPPLDTERVVLIAGRVEWRKGGDTLVEALAVLRRQGQAGEALLAGGSSGLVEGQPYQSWLEERAASLGVRCRFLGPIPQDDLPAVYGQSRVVAVPSRFESFSIVALEAMACGRPVVCSSSTGVAPLVERWGAGAVVGRDDPEALGEALLPFLESPEAAAEAGQRGRAGVQRELDPTAVARLREEAYREAVERHRRRRRGRVEAPGL